MSKWLAISALLIGLSICAGAFGAHSLKDRLDPYHFSVFEKGAFYHLTMSLGLFMMALAGTRDQLDPDLIAKLCLVLFAGIVIFSGSLYLLAFTGIKKFGMITPIGGTLMIVSWLILSYKLFTR